MTGFARAEGSDATSSWFWEVRSVNARGLDVRLRLPPGSEQLEPQARDILARRLVRGSVTANLTLKREAGLPEFRLNERALEQVLKAANRVAELTGGERPRIESLLALKGVLEVVEPEEDKAEAEARNALVLQSLAEAVEGLVRARAAEGERLAMVVAGQVDEIERLVDLIERAPGRGAAAISQRLAELVSRLMEPGAALDPARLHQEAVLIATRVDVAEELARLKAHVASLRDLVAEPSAVGRKLDFLAQEFNREANTLCSKSNDPEVTRAGLALKSVIDQMREQVQNIE
jgi:uncharacterized protein (TIGR00255 family)